MKLLQEMLYLLVFLKKAHTKKKLNKIMTASIGKNNSTKMLLFLWHVFSGAMFAHGFLCCHKVRAPVNSATRHRGSRAWEVLGKSPFQLLLNFSGWATSNSSLFGCKRLTTANGEGSRKDTSQQQHDSVPLSLPTSQSGKMLWGWEHEAFVLVHGELAGL